MTKKYKESDLDIHIYGSGRNKSFIMYTDFKRVEGVGPQWHTRVYPDIEGNKTKAVKQALRWLNKLYPSEPWIYKNHPRKIAITYNQFREAPRSFYETDERGESL
jgi:hypothetical protein